MAAISQVAGIELVPWGDYEIAHINFSMGRNAKIGCKYVESRSDTKQTRSKIESADDHYHEESEPIVGWHKDSYPFVCILMLSDCSDMIGGETAVLKANGEIDRINGQALVRKFPE